ncbi:hypothetical protein RJ640_026118 [Escallonia rubra]|uniref:Ultraviolet-B receptor UVR8 n=1 Tax=Escallonia rubra TaxID=112253 RepID=A0AA88QES4_9ASTE|nr:hypothetical protein RJ640_026118 [Escallonia rubra]
MNDYEYYTVSDKRGDFGRLGHGNSSDLFIPQPIKALDGLRIRQIACGDSHCLAVTMEGAVQRQYEFPTVIQSLHENAMCKDDLSSLNELFELGPAGFWGRNQNGQLGLGSTEDSLVPQRIEAFKGVCVKMVAAGAEHTAAVTIGGELYGWGWGRYGNLGLGDRNDRLVPEEVSTVDFGNRHLAAPELAATSLPVEGHLGPWHPTYLVLASALGMTLGMPCQACSLTFLHLGEKMVLVACGWRHTISVSSSGGLYTYGWSKYGQLGHGDFEDHLIPHKLEALHNHRISQISGGWRHTMALTSDGKLYGWGWNKKVVQISCGWRHTLAVTERHNVFSWGRGTNGQLGHGECVDRYCILNCSNFENFNLMCELASLTMGSVKWATYLLLPEYPAPV